MHCVSSASLSWFGTQHVYILLFVYVVYFSVLLTTSQTNVILGLCDLVQTGDGLMKKCVRELLLLEGVNLRCSSKNNVMVYV